MMGRGIGMGLWHLISLEARLAWRHRLVHVVLVVAVLFGLLIRFAIPGDIHPAAIDVGGWTGLMPPSVFGVAFDVHVLQPGVMKTPLNHLMIPLLLAIDVGLLGFMFGAVMVLQDKQCRTITCFRITPAGALAYISAKLTVNLALTLLNTVLLIGIGAHELLAYPAIYPLVLLSGVGMTLLGIGMAVFFRTLSSFFYPMACVGMVVALPMYPYLHPAATIPLIEILPSYWLIQGADAILFSPPASEVAPQGAFLMLAIFAVAGALFSLWAVSRRLLKEVA